MFPIKFYIVRGEVKMFRSNFKSKLCIYASELDEECYCTKMDSLKVEQALYYCSGHFNECHIYKKKKERDIDEILKDLQFSFCGKE